MKPNKFIVVALLGLLLLGVVAGIRGVTWFVQNEEFQQPMRPPFLEADETPRDTGLADEQAELDEKNRTKAYEPQAYRSIGGVSSRVIVWMLAQLHLLFAAFVLAVPMFALIIEFIGFRTKDQRYDKLAYEFTKLLSVSFSMTATSASSNRGRLPSTSWNGTRMADSSPPRTIPGFPSTCSGSTTARVW